MSGEITEAQVLRAIEQARQTVGHAQERLVALRDVVLADPELDEDERASRADVLDEAADLLETADRRLESAGSILDD